MNVRQPSWPGCTRSFLSCPWVRALKQIGSHSLLWLSEREARQLRHLLKFRMLWSFLFRSRLVDGGGAESLCKLCLGGSDQAGLGSACVGRKKRLWALADSFTSRYLLDQAQYILRLAMCSHLELTWKDSRGTSPRLILLSGSEKLGGKC